MRLQCGWRCRLARKRVDRARRVAAAQTRLAARELEERAKRERRQARAGSRRVRALFDAARRMEALPQAMPPPLPLAASPQAEPTASDVATPLRTQHHRRHVAGSPVPLGLPVDRAQRRDRRPAGRAANEQQPVQSRGTGTLARLIARLALPEAAEVARLALPEAAEPHALAAAARSVQRRWRERRWAIRRLLVATVALQCAWRGVRVRRKVAEAAAAVQQRSAMTITAAMRRLMWRRWRREAMTAEAGGEETAEAGAEQRDYWQSVFAAQSDLTAQMGVGWPRQVERNLEAARIRLRRERERREAHELGMAFAEGWGAQVEALRQQGVRLRIGAGTGGRQQRSHREQRQQRHQDAAG